MDNLKENLSNNLSDNLIKKSNFVIIIPIMIATFNFFLILYPTAMIEAGKEGLLMWFNQVLPTLLPFVVGANLLASLGFIHFMGAIMAPVMAPIFKVPGAGAFALLTGFTSGYPMGAKAVAHLRESNQITKSEAQRLIAFSNNAGPLFVIGFVGVGLFGSARIGYLLLISHIAAALLVGLFVRFLSKERPNIGDAGIRAAFRKYHEFRKRHYRGFGSALGTSVSNAMESMVLIGGFIVVFCVLIKALEIVGFFNIEGAGFVAGLLEMANGAKMVASGGPPNAAAFAMAAAIISFGGFSVHGQVAHFIRDTDIKFGPYLAAKAFQAFMAGVISSILW